MADVVSTNEFKNGMHIELEGSVWRIVEFQHVKPGKGGAFVRTKVKSIDSGSVVDKTFRAGEKFPRVFTEVKNMQYLYDSGDEVVFMDESTYEQMSLPHSSLEAELPYMQPSTPVQLLFVGGKPSGVQLPVLDRARGHRHRARREGRHGLERDEAGDARDGRRRRGAALREPGRPDQGRPPRRPLHQPRVSASAVVYSTDVSTLTAADLEGFFVDWPVRPSAERHLEILNGSDYVVLARDTSGKVVGFITAISDGVLSAFIPLLEVLPDWQGQGIGSELVRRMLAQLEDLYMVDLVCDPELEPFYRRFELTLLTGMGRRWRAVLAE